jgi:molecular chaperone DnaJ
MNKGDDSMFKAISEAYEILGDESNKKEYDNHNSSSSSSYTSTSGSKYAYNYEQRNSRYNNYGSTKYDHFKN